MWQKLLKLCKDSETILIARLQAIIGILLAAWLTIDPTIFSAYVSTKWIPVYLFAAGVITEIARRYRATDLK